MSQKNNLKIAEEWSRMSHDRRGQENKQRSRWKRPTTYIQSHIFRPTRISRNSQLFLSRSVKMPKRPIYLQPTDNLYRRTRRDLEFLCNYWDRLFIPNQSYDVRLPELLRANHLMRHLSSLSLPSNQGLRVNVSFTILDDDNRLEPEETYQL